MNFYQSKLMQILIIIVISIIGFFVPQNIPLEYWSLNDPSYGLQYLEISCASDFTGLVEIFLDSGSGFNEYETIKWNISPSDFAVTYRFPIPDKPLYRMQISTLTALGSLTVDNFNIINRKGEIVRRFFINDFCSVKNSTMVHATAKSFIITANSLKKQHLTEILNRNTLLPVGMNSRNVLRCLISCSYLTLMIIIINLAVYLNVTRKVYLKYFIQVFILLSSIAVLFSFVGNRGLIKNTFKYLFISYNI